MTSQVSASSWFILPQYFEYNNSLDDSQAFLNKIINNPNSEIIERVVTLMFVYALLAYVFIYKFSKNMADFEFNS